MDIPMSNDKKIDDVSLIRLLTLHQNDALGDLYDRYGRLMYSIAMNSVGDQVSAEEIVQDVFTHVWAKAKTYDPRIAKVSTWLVSITRNRAIDELRKRNVRPEKTNLSWEEISLKSYPFTQGSEEEAVLLERKMNVREALDTLAPCQREVLALAYFRGYSQSKIAKVLAIPLGTVKTRMRLAKQKLRLVLSRTMLESQ